MPTPGSNVGCKIYLAYSLYYYHEQAKVWLLAFLCLSVTTVFSQTEIPVNLYTGTPFIEVPLWTLTDYDISVPVSLSYAANGVKLQQDPGSFWTRMEFNRRGQYFARVARTAR